MHQYCLDIREMGLQLEHSSLETFLWIGITFATLSFYGYIPVWQMIYQNDLKDVWIYCPVSSLSILVRRLFGHAYFLGLKFKYSRLYISSFVQREMKNGSSLGGGKY